MRRPVRCQGAAGGEDGTGVWCEVTDDSGGSKRFSWHLGGPVRVAPGFSYTNRCGLAFGHLRQNDNAVGQGIAHWQEGNANLMTYPSDSAIQAMAECGVSICVLHLYWSQRGEYLPFDEPDMRRWVQSCHQQDIKCLVYATPADDAGTKGINREWVADLGLDGIYFDFGSVHTMSMRKGGVIGRYDREFPALDTLRLTRHFREAVGPDGIIISHSGGYAPDAFFHLNLNAYLPGEAGPHAAMLNDFRAAAYHTGMGYAVVHPWCEYQAFQTQHGAATYCAVGGFPHILFGRGTHQDNNYHRSVYRSAEFVLPYWQILSTLPMDRETTLFTAATAVAASTDQPAVHCCLYQRSPDQFLVTVANLGEACEPVLTLDERLLNLAGTYDVLRLGGPDLARLAVSDLGAWEGGQLGLGRLERDEYLGLLFTRGETPAHTRAALDRIARLVAAFNDPGPPTAPAGLSATAEQGLVKLEWQPAADDFHVVEYRLSRGPDAGDLQPLTAIEETTRYSDYTAPLGASVFYAVSAVDVAGNQGPQGAPVRVETPGAAVTWESLTEVNGHWAQAGEWLRQGAVRTPASSEGDALAFPATTARFVRAYFTGGQGNYGSAHVIEMTVRDPAGEEIKPERVTSTGSDPGHPDTEAADGITDKTSNGWWSDRTKPFPVWLTLEFGEPRSVAGVWLLTYWDDQRYYDYSVQVSMDGQEWTPVAATPGLSENARAPADLEFTDGTVAVTTLEMDPERAGGGLLFRCPDANNGYALTLEPRWDGNLVLDKLVGGKLQRLAGKFFPYSIHNPIPHLISVQCSGPVMRCYCDEVLAFEVRDETFAGGGVGLIVPSGRRLKFLNLCTAL